jgi:hypothetical protein
VKIWKKQTQIINKIHFFLDSSLKKAYFCCQLISIISYGYCPPFISRKILPHYLLKALAFDESL